MNLDSLTRLSDKDLIAEVQTFAGKERLATARLIAALAEMDARRLYLGEGCSSLFVYCTQVLRLSEHAAYGRIEAARAARRFPLILDLLSDGSITLTAVGLLSPHLTPENHHEALATARRKSKRDVEQLVAHMAPRSDVPTVIRKLPAAKPPDTPREQPALAAIADDQLSSPSSPIASAAKRAAVATPLAPERYKVQFTASRETYDKLRRAQDLLRHAIPDGNPAVIFDRALSLLLAQLEKSKLGSTKQPHLSRPPAEGSRHIPAAVRRAVWSRDGGRCAFVGTHGRCSERGFLEFHHLKPFAVGGSSLTDNMQLRCRAHNAHEANLYFGFGVVREHARPMYSVRTEWPLRARNSEPNRSLINHEPAGHLSWPIASLPSCPVWILSFSNEHKMDGANGDSSCLNTLDVRSERYPERELKAWQARRYGMLVRSNASAFIKQILCEKACNRPGSRFFGEAFVAATTGHDEGWYSSFKWLTSPRYLGDRQLSGHRGEFARALASHFPELARLQAKASRFADQLGEKPVAPDLWLISHGEHRFIEVKLPWDSVSRRQLAGLALIARHLRSELPISTSIVQLYPDSGTACSVDGLARQFKELYRAAGTG